MTKPENAQPGDRHHPFLTHRRPIELDEERSPFLLDCRRHLVTEITSRALCPTLLRGGEMFARRASVRSAEGRVGGFSMYLLITRG